jgi:hypothetical protein
MKTNFGYYKRESRFDVVRRQNQSVGNDRDNDNAFGCLRCTHFITNYRYKFSDFLFI